MSAAKHSAGSWRTELRTDLPFEAGYWVVIAEVTPGCFAPIADTSNRHHNVSPEDDEANAHALAAAPAMLAKLKDLGRECAECNGEGVLGVGYPAEGLKVGDPCPQCQDIRDVIAVAEGRQP